MSETLISGLHPNGCRLSVPAQSRISGQKPPRHGKPGSIIGPDGIIAGDDSLRLKAAYLHNDIEDYIAGATLSAFDPTAGDRSVRIPICYQYQNFANAKIDGFELESLYDASWGFAGLTVSIIDGHTVSDSGVIEDLSTIPSSQATAQLGFRFMEDRLMVGGEVQYNASPEATRLPTDYTLVNLSPATRRPIISSQLPRRQPVRRRLHQPAQRIDDRHHLRARPHAEARRHHAFRRLMHDDAD